MRGKLINITLTTQQEEFLNKQLATGKYADVNEVINKAFFLLAQEELEQKSIRQGRELAQKKLQEKLAILKGNKEENKPVAPERQILAEEFSKLCAATQAIRGVQNITEIEILAEIEAYRRGE
ncbi:hypothetical protein [Gloeocapsa sp. PCC 73106]|uniref:ribbon-helix-helix domain-containing protein n=1 Tax=Gloeocapsa sp. PCC 73106 TaxID=102232 RepID=UPI0002AC2D5C|nr:hypothetical protein [Gloeocapsa sp. PCC 73106]ELR96538.1 Uncharacterized protein family (UPF0156) [Gloeocapsa sp. PCC 73106]